MFRHALMALLVYNYHYFAYSPGFSAAEPLYTVVWYFSHLVIGEVLSGEIMCKFSSYWWHTRIFQIGNCWIKPLNQYVTYQLCHVFSTKYESWEVPHHSSFPLVTHVLLPFKCIAPLWNIVALLWLHNVDEVGDRMYNMNMVYVKMIKSSNKKWFIFLHCHCDDS